MHPFLLAHRSNFPSSGNSGIVQRENPLLFFHMQSKIKMWRKKSASYPISSPAFSNHGFQCWTRSSEKSSASIETVLVGRTSSGHFSAQGKAHIQVIQEWTWPAVDSSFNTHDASMSSRGPEHRWLALQVHGKTSGINSSVLQTSLLLPSISHLRWPPHSA